MNRSITILLAVGFLLLAGLGWWWLSPPQDEAPAASPATTVQTRPPGLPPRPESSRLPWLRSLQAENLTPDQKAVQIARIKRDYEEIRTKASAEYTAAGPTFPGGLNAFLRQLALLEREKRRDFAAILSPRELEELEVRETTAGQLVQRMLADTSATEEQRRAVFHLQQDFDDRYSLTFDTSPAALLERERTRVETQEKIRTELGDQLFPAWLRAEGTEFAYMASFVTQQGLPSSAALELWRTKNDFTLRRLEITAQSNLTLEQSRIAHAEVARQTQARVMSILGPGAMQAAGHEVLGWLPRK